MDNNTTPLTAVKARALAIGTRVYCTVFAVQGWYRLIAVRPRDGYIKISGFNTWNPPHNFTIMTEDDQS